MNRLARQRLGILAAGIPLALAVLFISGCASTADERNADLDERLRTRDERYYERLDRRTTRREHRDARNDAWFDSIMR